MSLRAIYDFIIETEATLQPLFFIVGVMGGLVPGVFFLVAHPRFELCGAAAQRVCDG